MCTVCWISIIDWVCVWLLIVVDFREKKNKFITVCVCVCVVNRKIPFSFGWSNLFRWFTNIRLRVLMPLSVDFYFFHFCCCCWSFYVCYSHQATIYSLSFICFRPFRGEAENKSREFCRLMPACLTHTHSHTCTQHILSDLWQNIHSVDIFITLWTIKTEEEAAARDNLWPNLISSVTECCLVYVCLYVSIAFWLPLYICNISNSCVTNQWMVTRLMRIKGSTHTHTHMHSFT